jgi:hypothetical protein
MTLERECFHLKGSCKEKCLGIKFEFWGLRTPRRSRKDERIFQNLYEHVRSMSNNSGIKGKMICGIWEEYASTATFYGNILVDRES